VGLRTTDPLDRFLTDLPARHLPQQSQGESAAPAWPSIRTTPISPGGTALRDGGRPPQDDADRYETVVLTAEAEAAMH